MFPLNTKQIISIAHDQSTCFSSLFHPFKQNKFLLHMINPRVYLLFFGLVQCATSHQVATCPLPKCCALCNRLCHCVVPHALTCHFCPFATGCDCLSHMLCMLQDVQLVTFTCFNVHWTRSLGGPEARSNLLWRVGQLLS